MNEEDTYRRTDTDILSAWETMLAQPASGVPIALIEAELGLSVFDLAQLFIIQKAVAEAAAKRMEELKALLLARWPDGCSTVDVPGVGGVSYAAATVQHKVDQDAVEAQVADYAQRLKAFGVDVPATLPRKAAKVAAGLRVVKPAATKQAVETRR